MISFSCPRKHQLPKEKAQESLKCQNFSTKNPFFGTHPLTNNELKKLHQEKPASAIFTSTDPSCFHKYLNSDDSLTLWCLPSKKSCTQERWVFTGFPLIMTNFYMIGLHKNVFNMLANQNTTFISSCNWKNIRKKEVKVVRKLWKWKKMKNAKVASWTAHQSQTKTFQKLVFKLATISSSKLCIPFNRWLSPSPNLPKIADKMSFPFNFAKILKGCHFMVHGSKNLKHWPDTTIDTTFRKNILASLLLFHFVWS